MPDISGLVNELTLKTDNILVWNQHFLVSPSRSAVLESDLGLSYVPVTIELVSDFSAIIALIHVAESQGRPLRVESINMSRISEPNDDEHGHRIRANVILELLYNPESGDEGS